MDIKERRCPHCPKVIQSMYPKQLDYNYKAHLLSCENKQSNTQMNNEKEVQQNNGRTTDDGRIEYDSDRTTSAE